MANSVSVGLTRQTGLLAEMQAVANNIANVSTTGFRKEGIVFAEHIAALDDPGGSLSMAQASVRTTNTAQGALKATGGAFDLAIEGPGYFLISTPEGNQLTRAGGFVASADGTLSTLDGHPVLDSGSSPVFVPTDIGKISIAGDGTVSADGDPIGQIGLFLPNDPLSIQRRDGVRFSADGGVTPYPEGRILQGFVEGSNVDPVGEVARMIEIQRAYELGQSFLEQEDKRIGSVISALGGK